MLVYLSVAGELALRGHDVHFLTPRCHRAFSEGSVDGMFGLAAAASSSSPSSASPASRDDGHDSYGKAPDGSEPSSNKVNQLEPTTAASCPAHADVRRTCTSWALPSVHGLPAVRRSTS